MPLPDIVKDFVMIIKAPALTSEQKIEKIVYYLAYVDRVENATFIQMHDAQQMPVTIPYQRRWFKPNLPPENLNVFQSLEAYARGLGYQEVANIFSRFCEPVVRDNLIPRTQAVLDDLYNSERYPEHELIIIDAKIDMQRQFLDAAERLAFLQRLHQAAALLFQYRNAQHNQLNPSAMLTQIETYTGQYDGLKNKADSYARVFNMNIDDEMPVPELTTIAQCVSLLDQILQKLKNHATAIADADNAVGNAAEYVKQARLYHAVVIHMGHLFFERLKNLSEQNPQNNDYVTFEGRLNQLADFMSINRSELMPVNQTYQTIHQATLDRQNKADTLDDKYTCMLCSSVMDNPVKLPDGTYIELVMAERLFRGSLSAKNPFTRELMTRSVLKIDVKMQDEINKAVGEAVRPKVPM